MITGTQDIENTTKEIGEEVRGVDAVTTINGMIERDKPTIKGMSTGAGIITGEEPAIIQIPNGMIE